MPVDRKNPQNRSIRQEVADLGVLGYLHEYPVALIGLGIIFLLLSIIFHPAPGAPQHGWLAYGATFAREFGFALLIAYFISMGIERQSRAQHNERVSEQIDMIKRDVFEAV
jgi:hypothetical protein